MRGRRPRRPFSSPRDKRQMILDIAQWPIELAADARLHGRLAERYGPFLVAAAPDGTVPRFRLSLEVDDAADRPGLHPTFVANPPVQAAGSLDAVTLSGDGLRARLDWNAGEGRARVPDSMAHVDLSIRVALGVGLLREGATLLHASGVLRDRFGIAFSGASGAGKSTVAALCRAGGLTVLADEMLAFRRTGAGHRFHGTPFWRGTTASGPCGALLFLVQAERHAVRHLPPGEALPRLLAAGGAPLAIPAVQEAFFASCAEILRRVPAYELRFTRDAGFWDVLDRLPEFAFFRPAVPTQGRPAPLTGRLPRL